MGDLIGAGREGGRDRRQAVAPEPFRRPSANPRELWDVARFGDRTERADLLFVFMDVYVRVGERMPEAQHQRGDGNPPLQSAPRSWFNVCHGRRMSEAGDVADVPSHGVLPQRHSAPLPRSSSFPCDAVTKPEWELPLH